MRGHKILLPSCPNKQIYCISLSPDVYVLDSRRALTKLYANSFHGIPYLCRDMNSFQKIG